MPGDVVVEERDQVVCEYIWGVCVKHDVACACRTVARYRQSIEHEAMRKADALLAEIARDAVGQDAPINAGLNSVQAVLIYFFGAASKWTEERLEEVLRRKAEAERDK